MGHNSGCGGGGEMQDTNATFMLYLCIFASLKHRGGVGWGGGRWWSDGGECGSCDAGLYDGQHIQCNPSGTMSIPQDDIVPLLLHWMCST